MAKPEVKRMWNGGPLREWSLTRFGHWIPYEHGFAGSYVCERCNHTTVGVYKLDTVWVCGTCKEALRPKQTQPYALRKHAVGRRGAS